MFQNNAQYIFDFKKEQNTTNWYVVNDGVMGGLSKGSISINESGYGHFKGYVTTENNGGFSSIRLAFERKNVSNFKQVVLRVKGDGKKYQLRIKEKSSQRYSYITIFSTSEEWETIKIPFNSFYPSFRGYNLDKPNYSGEVMDEIAILFGNKKKESFSLQIESILLD